MQKVIIMGFVGRDPEEKFTSNGKKLNYFPLGINVNKGGEKITFWYKVNCWGDIFSSVIPHIKKGNCLTVIGDLNPITTYQNKKGDIAIDLSINCHSINFVPLMNKKEEKKENDNIYDFGELQ